MNSKQCQKIRSLMRTDFFGTLRGTRTPDPLLRRQMLYPAELSAQIFTYIIPQTLSLRDSGAGDGNRTHTASLEGWNSSH